MGTYKYRRKESFSLRLCLLIGVYTHKKRPRTFEHR